MDRKTAPKVGKSLLEPTTRHVCPPPQHGRRAFVVRNAVPRTEDAEFVHDRRYYVRLPAVLMQHGRKEKFPRKAFRIFEPALERETLFTPRDSLLRKPAKTERERTGGEGAPTGIVATEAKRVPAMSIDVVERDTPLGVLQAGLDVVLKKQGRPRRVVRLKL